MNNKQKVYSILAHVMDINVASITDETGPDNVESWDSFNALMLISEFEEQFGLTFTMDEVAGVRKVRDIFNILKNHGVEFTNE